MKVFLAGGTGFVGKNLLQDLLIAGHNVGLLVRKGSEGKVTQKDGITFIYGDITDAASLEGRLIGFDAVINLVGIIREFHKRRITFERLHFEGTKNLVDAAKSQGVSRFIQMSALGSRPDANSLYHKTKFSAERYLIKSGLTYTIFKPSIIFGPEDKFINYFAGMIKSSPFMPVIGNGKGKLQPVYVKDITQGFVKALAMQETFNKSYEAGGPKRYTFTELIDLITRTIGKKVIKIHIPVFVMRWMACLLEEFPSFPLTREQIVMLAEDNTCDEKDYFKTFNILPTPLEEVLVQYLSL